LSPISSFLVIAAVTGALGLHAVCKRYTRPIPGISGAGLLALLGVTLSVQLFTAVQAFAKRREDPGAISTRSDFGYRVFYHDKTWADWEKAALWLKANAPKDAVVATISPHLLYMLTGLHAVFPPMAEDPAEARRLMQTVPISYVVVDRLEFLDIAQRYARPAVENDAAHWHSVYSIDGTEIFASRPSDQENSRGATTH
jgi:hypothetical protein